MMTPRPVQDRLQDRLTLCTQGLSHQRFMAAINYFQSLCKSEFRLTERSPRTSKLLEQLALARPTHEHDDKMPATATASTYTLPIGGISPVFAKLDTQLMRLLALQTKPLTINDLPRLLLQAMTEQQAPFQLIHHTQKHGAEVAYNSVLTLKNAPWFRDIEPQQALANLIFLMACAHDSIFTRDRGYDEAASALLLIHLLNLDATPKIESFAALQAREDLIKIIYYTIVGGTFPIFPKDQKAMIVLGHQFEAAAHAAAIIETPNVGGLSFRGQTQRHLAYISRSDSETSPSALTPSLKTSLLASVRTCITFADVNLHANPQLLASCATAQEQSMTATSAITTLSHHLRVDDALKNLLFARIKTGRDFDPAQFDAALLCLGQGLRVGLEEGWMLKEGTLMLKTSPGPDGAPCPPNAVDQAITPLIMIYNSLVAASLDAAKPLLDGAASDALYTADNIKNMLLRLIKFFEGEQAFAGAHLSKGFDLEFSAAAFVGTNFWPTASKIYQDLAKYATTLLEDTPALQREFILNLMCIASYQHGSAMAEAITAPGFDLDAYTQAIGTRRRTDFGPLTLSNASSTSLTATTLTSPSRHWIPRLKLPAAAIPEGSHSERSAATHSLARTPAPADHNTTRPTPTTALETIHRSTSAITGAPQNPAIDQVTGVVLEADADNEPASCCSCLTAIVTWLRGDNRVGIAPSEQNP